MSNAQSPVERAPWDRDDAFRSFVDRNDDLMLVVDPQVRIVYVNEGAQRIFGVAREECTGRSLLEFVHPEDLERTQAAFTAWSSASVATSFTFENRQRSWSGATRHVLWTVTPCRGEGGRLRSLALCGRDVDAFWRLAGDRDQRAARYLALLRGMLDPVVTIDSHGVIRNVSHSVTTVLGYAPEELVGKNVNVLMTEPHRAGHDGYLREYKDTGRAVLLNQTREFEVLHRDGRRLLCELSLSRVDVPGDDEPLFIGSLRDVTARRRAEQELARSEQRFRAIFDQEFQFVGLLTVEGQVIEVNRAALEAIGVARAQVIGRSFWETDWWNRSPADAERVKQAIRSAAEGQFVRFETSFRRPSGEPLEVDFSLKPIRDEHGLVVLLLPEGRDITRLREVQRRETAMLRALATIGESASLLAHEIKNPITAVNLALRAVADQLGEEHHAVLDDLAKRMHKLELTMRRTLSFVRPLNLERRRASARSLLEGAAQALRPELDASHVALEIACAPDLPELEVDAYLLQDALGNLLKNALEALPGGGRVRLAASADRDALALSVEDDGPGVSPKLEHELFRPFVTDKAHGTGLGLVLCKRIVEEHGGTIECGRSPLLGGARFALRLPLSKATVRRGHERSRT